MEMLLKAIKSIFKKKNLDVLIFLIACHIGVLFGAWWFTNPHFKTPPCKVCGRANTQGKELLWQYKTEHGMPFMKKKNVYYCENHINDAPRIIKNLPSEEDTTKKRFLLSSVLSSVLLLFVVFLAAIIELDFNYLIIFPFLLGGLFLLMGPTSNFTIHTLVALLFITPIVIYYFWYKISMKEASHFH